MATIYSDIRELTHSTPGAPMRGVISITDWEWFQFLREHPGLDEVNFWRPTDVRNPYLEPGTPFLLKLRSDRRSADRADRRSADSQHRR